MTYTLGSLDLGIVRGETTTKDAQLFQIPIPSSDSNSSIVIDLFGVSKTIELKGTKVCATTGDVRTFTSQLMNAVNGSQRKIAYNSDAVGSSIYVYINSVEWEYEEGSVLSVNYTINMIQGS